MEAKFRISKNRLVDWALKRALLVRSPWLLRLRARLTREEALDAGMISVVVPFHNVESYLRAALDSLRFQRYFDLQVIMVDDGSTDSSAAIAQQFVGQDSRFTLIRTEGVGPGAARNAGLAHSKGEFIAFVDGDDIVPMGAFYRLASSLQDSKSDFAVGAFEHLRGNARWRSPWVAREHGTTKLGVTLEEVPGITRNVFPWNKLFRREFFFRIVKQFPEGIVYEDQVPTALAYIFAESFDVLHESVYHWRQRASRDSITQNRSKLPHLENRLHVLSELDEIYRTEATENVYREWLVKSLTEDLVPFYEASQSANERYLRTLQKISQHLREKLSDDEWHALPEPRRAMVEAAVSGDFARLPALIAAL